MNNRSVVRGTVVFLAATALSLSVHAQQFRAYLDPSGSDANPCTLPQPCRLLPAAIAAVANGGEIWLLDSANYNVGPVNVNKSVTILAIPGAVGSVVALGGNAIEITTPGVKVALRNLVIVPFPGGGGTNGISMTAGSVLTVENCLVANLPGTGIAVNAGAAVRVTDTTIRDNGLHGIALDGGAGGVVTRATISGNMHGVLVLGTGVSSTTADIADTTIDGHTNGVYAWSQSAAATLRVSVRDSRVVRSSSYGIAAQSDAAGTVTLAASGNMVSNNTTGGIGAFSSGAKVWAAGNTVSGNGYGLVNNSALLESASSNAVRNNATGNSSGTITPIAPM